MKKKLHRYIKFIQIAFWPVLIGLLFLAYRGFYKPDPYIMARYAPFSTGLLWSLKIGIPLLAAYIIGLLWGYKTDRMSRANTATLLAGMLICGVIGMVMIYHEYRSTMGPVHGFHPYMQLTPPDVPEMDDQNVHILCLGGPATASTDSQGRGWPERVEALLSRRLNRKDIRVYNLGNPWYTSQHSLIFYETSLRDCHPDAVLIMHTMNDLLHNADFSYFSQGPFQKDYGHFNGPLHGFVQPKGFFSFMSWMIKSLWYHSPRDTIITSDFPGLVSFKQNLNSLADLAEIDDVPVIFITQPSLFKENMSEAELEALTLLPFKAIGPRKQWHVMTAVYGFRKYRQAILDVAEERHIPCLDLDPQIPKTLEYFRDEVHYTEPALDKIAEAVTQSLIIHLQ